MYPCEIHVGFSHLKYLCNERARKACGPQYP